MSYDASYKVTKYRKKCDVANPNRDTCDFGQKYSRFLVSKPCQILKKSSLLGFFFFLSCDKMINDFLKILNFFKTEFLETINFLCLHHLIFFNLKKMMNSSFYSFLKFWRPKFFFLCLRIENDGFDDKILSLS